MVLPHIHNACKPVEEGLQCPRTHGHLSERIKIKLDIFTDAVLHKCILNYSFKSLFSGPGTILRDQLSYIFNFLSITMIRSIGISLISLKRWEKRKCLCVAAVTV